MALANLLRWYLNNTSQLGVRRTPVRAQSVWTIQVFTSAGGSTSCKGWGVAGPPVHAEGGISVKQILSTEVGVLKKCW